MKSKLILILALTVLAFPTLAQATQFAIVGPRAMGMGGASVAAVNDATAVYWNPAALADYKKVEIRIPAGAAIRDHIGLQDKWDRINAIYQTSSPSPALLTELDQLLTDLDKPKSGTDIDAHVGLLVSIPAGRSAFAINALGLAYAGIFPTIDTLNRTQTISSCPSSSILCNNSAVTGVGLVSAEPGVSFATPIGEKFFIGANAKMMSVTTYVHSEYLRTGDFDTFIDNLDLSETPSSEASIDAGILFKASENLRLGIVGRYLNSPSFPFQGWVALRGGTGNVSIAMMPAPYYFEIEPQFRAGVAWKPVNAVTLSADYDLSKNKSLGIPGYEDQTMAVGAEIRLPKEIASLRAGAYKNTAADDANLVYTAGLGLRIFFFRMDVAGAYDFDDKEGQVSANLAFRF